MIQAAELSLQVANEYLQLVRHVYDDPNWANSTKWEGAGMPSTYRLKKGSEKIHPAQIKSACWGKSVGSQWVASDGAAWLWWPSYLHRELIQSSGKVLACLSHTSPRNNQKKINLAQINCACYNMIMRLCRTSEIVLNLLVVRKVRFSQVKLGAEDEKLL